jgi:hypothetical protein
MYHNLNLIIETSSSLPVINQKHSSRKASGRPELVSGRLFGFSNNFQAHSHIYSLFCSDEAIVALAYLIADKRLDCNGMLKRST